MHKNSEVVAKINDLLIDAFQRYVPYGHMASKAVLKRLKTTACCDVVSCGRDDIFKIIASYMEILETDQDTVIALIGSGTWGLNPAFVAIKCVGQDVYISAMAKEGLIKQRTAERAVDRLREIILGGF